MTKQETQHLKSVVAVGLVGYLLYLAWRNGGSFKQLPDGYRVKVDPAQAASLLAGPLRAKYPFAANLVQGGAESLVERLGSKFGLDSVRL